MIDPSPEPQIVYSKPPKVTFFGRLKTRRFLAISIIVHLLIGAGATVLVVQNIAAKRKLTFTSAPPSPNPSTRALEHQVQMAKKQQTMSAPASAKRITTTALSKIALPDMPVLPAMSESVAPSHMGIAGATGLGIGGGGGGMGGGGGGPTMFGFKTSGVGLPGHFYDLKEFRNRQPSGVTKVAYSDIVQKFVREGWHESFFSSKYFRASLSLYATQIFTPKFPAELAPQAYGVEKEVQPRFWVALYSGFVAPPDSGIYHFVGAGDDVLMVRFNNENVLDSCWEMQVEHYKPVAPVLAHYAYNWVGVNNKYATIPNGFALGPAITVTKGQYYPIQILIGEQPGGESGFCLLIEKEGDNYKKDPKGNPILPIFRLSNQPLAAPPPGAGAYAPYQENGPIWSSKPADQGNASDNPFGWTN